jgi:hypothetical protein
MKEIEIQEQIKQLKLEYRDIKSVLESVSRDLNNTVHLRGALSGAGAAAELILKCVYRREKVVDSKIPSDRAYEIKKVESEKMMLDELIRSVENFLPLRVVTHLRTIQAWRNIGSHSKGQVSESVNQATLQVVSLALSELVTWFIVEYLNHDLDFFANVEVIPTEKSIEVPSSSKAEELNSFSEGLWKIWSGKGDDLRYGFINENGEIVVHPMFEVVSSNLEVHSSGEMKTNKLRTVSINNKWGVIDSKGKWLLQPMFSYIDDFYNGLAVASIGEKRGVIDESGNWLIQPIFEEIGTFKDDIATARKSDEFGFIDKSGNWVIEPKFNNVFSEGFVEDLCGVEIGDRWGYIDKSGVVVLQPEFEEVYPFCGGHAIVRLNEKSGLIDRSGNWVIHPMYDWLMHWQDGTYVATVGGKSGVISRNNEWIVQPIFEHFSPIDNLRAAVNSDEKFGAIDKFGKWLIQPIYEEGLFFNEDVAGACISEKFGYIDKMGNWVIQPMFDSATSFIGGLALVSLSGKYGYINKSGNWVFQPTMDEEDDDFDFDLLDDDDFELENEEDESNESESLEFYAEDFNLENYFSKVSSKLKIQDEIDSNKVNTFLSNFGGEDYRELCKDHEMWVFYDDTFWQSGKEGFLIMSDSNWVYFYFKLNGGHGTFAFVIDVGDDGVLINSIGFQRGELIATLVQDEKESEYSLSALPSEVCKALFDFYVNEIESRKCFE